MPDVSASRSPEPELLGEQGRPFTNILCAVDGTSRSIAAVEQAAVLAGPQGHMTLLAVTAEGGSGAHHSAAISPRRAERILERAIRIADRAEVACRTILDPAGPPSQVILERAAEHDLLALGAPWASWLGGALLDGVAEAVLGSFSTPALAARAVPNALDFARHILVASDGLDGSDELVDLAARLAQACGGRLTLVHVAGAESRARPHRIESQGEKLRRALGDRAELRVEVGAADEAITHVASEGGCSLVVTCSRRLRGLGSLGSVSRRVVHKAPCSVLLMPPQPVRD